MGRPPSKAAGPPLGPFRETATGCVAGENVAAWWEDVCLSVGACCGDKITLCAPFGRQQDSRKPGSARWLGGNNTVGDISRAKTANV
jgi:hypothetical protein